MNQIDNVPKLNHSNAFNLASLQNKINQIGSGQILISDKNVAQKVQNWMGPQEWVNPKAKRQNQAKAQNRKQNEQILFDFDLSNKEKEVDIFAQDGKKKKEKQQDLLEQYKPYFSEIQQKYLMQVDYKKDPFSESHLSMTRQNNNIFNELNEQINIAEENDEIENNEADFNFLDGEAEMYVNGEIQTDDEDMNQAE